MPYAEAMARFGSDKPDLRIPLELIDIKDLMAQVDLRSSVVQRMIRMAVSRF